MIFNLIILCGRRKVKISKVESDLLKSNEDLAPQSRKILQRSVWGGAQTCTPPPIIQTPVNFPNFAELHLQSVRMYHFQIWQFY